MINGMTIPTAIAQELALYKDPEASEIKKKFANSAALRMMPDPVRDYLTPKDVKDERESKGTDFWGYGNKKKAYEKAKTHLIEDMVSYREICKQLNNKDYFRATINLSKDFGGEYQLQLVPFNDKVDN